MLIHSLLSLITDVKGKIEGLSLEALALFYLNFD